MLDNAKTLAGFRLHSLIGVIGKVDEFYFDDHFWAIRYLVAETGNWLMDRKVLITPHAILTVHNQEQYISIDLTEKQIEDSPSLDSDKPISRRFEEAYYGYYGYPWYWRGNYMWGTHPYIVRDHKKWSEPAQDSKFWDLHLRSTREVSGYTIHAIDGQVGYVDDFIIDDLLWAIRYLVINTQNSVPEKKVLISPHWIERISWKESKVYINLLREDILKSPEFTQVSLLTREYENALHQHYKRQGYWEEDLDSQGHSS